MKMFNEVNQSEKNKMAFSWSGGKDSAFGLLTMLHQENIHISALFSTVKAEDSRVPFHEISQTLLIKQFEAISIPYNIVHIPQGADNKTYEAKLAALFQLYRNNGVSEIVFADLFLEDIRTYRESLVKKNNLAAHFPLWGAETAQIALNILNSGIKAVITCVDLSKLSADWLGKEYNAAFIQSLPLDVDPCGENGEFHTFVYDAPFFKQIIDFKRMRQFTTYDGKFAHLALDSAD